MFYRLRVPCIWHNIVCMVVAKNGGFKPNINLYSLIHNGNIECLDVAIKNNQIDQNDYFEIDDVITIEMLNIFHKHNIQISRELIIGVIDNLENDESEYFKYLNENNIIFVSDDYQYVKEAWNVVAIHKELSVPFDIDENAVYFLRKCWCDVAFFYLQYINEHNGIKWDIPNFTRWFCWWSPSRKCIEYAIRHGAVFDRNELKNKPQVIDILDDIANTNAEMETLKTADDTQEAKK